MVGVVFFRRNDRRLLCICVHIHAMQRIEVEILEERYSDSRWVLGCRVHC